MSKSSGPRKLSVRAAYEQFRPWVSRLAGKYVRMSCKLDPGLSLSAAVAEVNFYFVKNYPQYDPAGGSTIIGYMKEVIWKDLFSDFRKLVRRNKILPRVPQHEEVSVTLAAEVKYVPDFDVQEFSMSANPFVRSDVEAVVRAVLVREILELPSPTKCRVAVCKKLLAGGWSRRRVKCAFEEIQNLLRVS